VLESGLAADSGAVRQFQLAVPATLHDALMARLDRLASVKGIAQTAAALGREFSYRMLAACTGLDRRRLQQGLVQLTEAGLLFCTGQPPDASYTFKHALVRDVAYNSMLLSRRAALHAGIARMLEAKFTEAVTMQPEVLAYHYTEAGLIEQAIPWWQRAGDRALTQSAHVEATSHFQRALALLQQRPEGPERDHLEGELRFRLIAPLVVTIGFASPQSEENYARIAQLKKSGGPTDEALRVLWGQAALALVRSDLSTAESLAEKLIQRATQADFRNVSSLGHSLMAYVSLVRGDIRRARERFDIAMKEFNPEGSRFVFDKWPYDFLIALTSRRMLVLQQQGCFDQATREGEGALAEARRIGSKKGRLTGIDRTEERTRRDHTEGYVLLHIGLANVIAGGVHGARIAVSALGRLADHADIQYFRWHEEILRGWVEAKSGALDQGIARIRYGLELRHERMANLWVPVYVLTLAELLIENGRHQEAFPIFSECEKLCRELQQHYIEPELNRLRGVAFKATGADGSTVAAAFDLARQTARSRGAKLFELRAATTYARVMRDQRRVREAYDLLAPVYGWFTEGFETADLKKAKALLDGLR
jgi:tetratricopeptide (TPR) repeat protein